MKRLCKLFRVVPALATLSLVIGCTTKEPSKPEGIQKGDYSYFKTYMKWFIGEEMNKGDIVGLSIAFIDDGKIVWQEGFGYANKAKKIKATPQTRYRAGSVTKLFNASAVMKLVEQGKMDLDKPLKAYLPQFSIKSRFGSTDAITPRNILTHHSGLPSDQIDRMFAKNPLMYDEMVDVIKESYVAYKPNTIFSYSNTGITLLGDAVEKTSGIKYVDYIEKTILKPLGMNDSDISITLSGKNTSNAYTKGKETVEYGIGDLPAGALNSNVIDLSKFAIMFMNEGKFNGNSILQPSSIKQMKEVQNANVKLDVGRKIGLGLYIDDVTLPNENVYHHGGGTIAHRAMLMVAPKSKFGVIILSNTATTNVNKIAQETLKKAYEVKKGIKIKEEIKKATYADRPLKEGTYASIFGKVKGIKKSENIYDVETPNGNFRLTKQKNNAYKAKLKLLFGLIHFGGEDLEELELYSDFIDGYEVVVARIRGKDTIIGNLIKPTPISNKWKQRVGEYTLLNPMEPKELEIEKISAYIEEGFMVIEQKMTSGETSKIILRAVNDNEAIIEGLGRGMQETIVYKDGLIHHSGLRYKRKD